MLFKNKNAMLIFLIMVFEIDGIWVKIHSKKMCLIQQSKGKLVSNI